jgi:hypothetical protein
MRSIKLFIWVIIFIGTFSYGNCQTKKSIKPKTTQQSLDGFIKLNFKKSIRIDKVLIGNFCESEVYFVQGFDAKGVLNERQMIIKKDNKFAISNRFFYHCENFGMIHHKHKNRKIETQNDLQNLMVLYDGEGKFRVKDATLKKIEKQAIDDEEHIGATLEFVSFKDYVTEKNCENF